MGGAHRRVQSGIALACRMLAPRCSWPAGRAGNTNEPLHLAKLADFLLNTHGGNVRLCCGASWYVVVEASLVQQWLYSSGNR